MLAREGYVCGHSGKMHLGRNDRTPRGYHYYFGIPGYTGIHNGPCTYTFRDRPLFGEPIS